MATQFDRHSRCVEGSIEAVSYAMTASVVINPSPTCLHTSCSWSFANSRRPLRMQAPPSSALRIEAAPVAPQQPSAARSGMQTMEPYVRRGPDTPKPSYAAIDAEPQNRLFMHLFREASFIAVTHDCRGGKYGSVVSSWSLPVKCGCPLGAERDGNTSCRSWQRASARTLQSQGALPPPMQPKLSQVPLMHSMQSTHFSCEVQPRASCQQDVITCSMSALRPK